MRILLVVQLNGFARDVSQAVTKRFTSTGVFQSRVRNAETYLLPPPSTTAVSCSTCS